jgi:hypothetical protein
MDQVSKSILERGFSERKTPVRQAIGRSLASYGRDIRIRAVTMRVASETLGLIVDIWVSEISPD